LTLIDVFDYCRFQGSQRFFARWSDGAYIWCADQRGFELTTGRMHQYGESHDVSFSARKTPGPYLSKTHTLHLTLSEIRTFAR
jgi:hypothetical protein